MKFIPLFILSALLYTSCTRTKYINFDTIHLLNNPEWRIYDTINALKDLEIRSDSMAYQGEKVEDLYGNQLTFEHYKLFLTMNVRSSGPPVRPHPSMHYRWSYMPEDIEVDLLVSDTLSADALSSLKKESTDVNIEKGYIGKNSLLYINDYHYEYQYLIINLKNRRVYKLKQAENNIKYTHRSILDDFVANEHYKGIQFIIVSYQRVYSIGDCLKSSLDCLDSEK